MGPMSQKVAHGEDQSGRPLLVVASERVGVRKAFKVLTFMATWDRARRAMRKQALTLDEYADWWKEPRSTSFRHQALFREAFPGEETPDRLLDMAEGQWIERKGVSALGAVVVA